MATGFIKKIMPAGFGYIKVDGQDQDVFYHPGDFSETMKAEVASNPLREGEQEKVEFEIVEGPKGPRAGNLRRAGAAAPAMEAEAEGEMPAAASEAEAEEMPMAA